MMRSLVLRIVVWGSVLPMLLFFANDVAASGQYASFGLRYTNWLHVQPPANIDPELFQIIEGSYDANEQLRIDAGLVLSDDLDDVLSGFFGGVRYKFMAIKIERGNIGGTFSHSANRLAPFEESRFDGSYFFIGAGVDTGLIFSPDLINSTDSIPAIVGLAYVHYKMPTTMYLDYQEGGGAVGPEYALDPECGSHSIDLWVRFDNLRAVMRDLGLGADNIWLIYDDDNRTRLAFGLEMELLLGFSWVSPSDKVANEVERATGLEYEQMSSGVAVPPFSFAFGMGVGLVYTMPFYDGQVGASIGIEGRTHSSKGMRIGAYNHYDGDPSSADKVNGSCCKDGVLEMLWGPIGKVAYAW
ncbi:MAG: hypothetical protein V2A73_09540 [Pseudomonadota bacterium]